MPITVYENLFSLYKWQETKFRTVISKLRSTSVTCCYSWNGWADHIHSLYRSCRPARCISATMCDDDSKSLTPFIINSSSRYGLTMMTILWKTRWSVRWHLPELIVDAGSVSRHTWSTSFDCNYRRAAVTSVSSHRTALPGFIRRTCRLQVYAHLQSSGIVRCHGPARCQTDGWWSSMCPRPTVITV